MTDTTPSAITRRIAGILWPDVQFAKKIAPGVFEYCCAGHGGIVALVSAATDIPPSAVEVARRHNLIDEYVIVQRGRRTTLHLRSQYNRTSWDSWVDRLGERWIVDRGEVWVGEEDCDWATIVVSSSALLDKWVATRSGTDKLDLIDYPRANCSRWNADYLAELEGSLV